MSAHEATKEPSSGHSGVAVSTVLKLVRGNPTPEELGAVVALLAARSAAGGVPEEPAPTRSLWATPQLRGTLAHGPGAWRASGLPR